MSNLFACMKPAAPPVSDEETASFQTPSEQALAEEQTEQGDLSPDEIRFASDYLGQAAAVESEKKLSEVSVHIGALCLCYCY